MKANTLQEQKNNTNNSRNNCRYQRKVQVLIQSDSTRVVKQEGNYDSDPISGQQSNTNGFKHSTPPEDGK